MSETTEQARADVERARERLAGDLNALEYRVQTLTDWQYYYRRYPWAVLGAAFGGALLLGYLVTPAARE